MRPLFEAYLARQPRPLSAYAYAAQMLWQDHFQFSWVEVRHHFLLFAEYDGCIYMPLPPLGEPDPMLISACFDWMDARNPHSTISRIENVAETDRAFYLSAGWEAVEKTPEYLYERAAQVSLRGNAYKTQRWACNAFKRRYTPHARPYISADYPAAALLFKKWQEALRERHSKDPAALQMLDDTAPVHHRALERSIALTGWVVETPLGLAGYTLGCPLSSEMFCVILEVADPTLSGAAAYLFRSFCESLSDYRWINAMDDSGLESLRRVKQAAHPARLEPCYLIRHPRLA